MKAYLVFVAAYRRKIMNTAIIDDIKRHASRIYKKSGAVLLKVNGEADHVHMLLDVNPNVTERSSGDDASGQDPTVLSPSETVLQLRLSGII